METKYGKSVLTLNGYGADWARNHINSGSDEIDIDMGKNSVQEDFFDFIMECSDLNDKSLEEIKCNFDTNSMIEVEDGAREVLEEKYEEQSDYYFIKAEEA